MIFKLTQKIMLALMLFISALPISAQIGYQVSLLDNATGEPRANERVTVTVRITDSDGKTVCDETKNETSNDFGVISMSVGDSDTFANADWSKLPFFIEASVDGRLLGKSQILSVPVAEHAKHTGSLTKEHLCSKEWCKGNRKYKFQGNGTYVYIRGSDDSYSIEEGAYSIDGNNIFLIRNHDDHQDAKVLFYSPEWDSIIDTYDG